MRAVAGSVELVLLLIYTARYLIFSVMALGVVIQSYANELGNWTATKLHIVQPSLLLLSYCPTAARLQCCYVVPPHAYVATLPRPVYESSFWTSE